MATKARPYWHLDAKWLTGVALAAALAGTLPVASLYLATGPRPARTVIAHVMASLTSPKGIDSDAGLAEFSEQVRRDGSATVNFGGVPAVITAKDVETLSPRELRLKVCAPFAERFYELGPRGMAAVQGVDARKAETDATFLRPLTRDGHDNLGVVLRWMVGADLLLLGLAVFFSRRFGRLVTPGVVLLLTGLPGPLFVGLSRHVAGPGDMTRSEDGSPFAMVGSVAGYILPVLARYFASTYVAVLVAGAVLLVVAFVAKLVWRLTRRPAGGTASVSGKDGEPVEDVLCR